MRPGRIALSAAGILRLQDRWGADADGVFACPVPDHNGTAFLGEPPNDPVGEVRLLCNCTGRWRSLGEVRAAEAYGFDSFRTNIQLAAWTRRLFWEACSFDPVAVPLPPLSDDEPAAVRRAHEGFALLLGLRWADGPKREAPFTIGFAAAWCPLTQWEARVAVQRLVETGVIVEARRQGRLVYYLPGDTEHNAAHDARDDHVDHRDVDVVDETADGWRPRLPSEGAPDGYVAGTDAGGLT